MRITKFNAFTLAEVLITLAIIGVVAAMTMPTLINNTNGAQFKTAYKKALSVLNQAVVMNIALDDYDLKGTSVETDATDGADFNQSSVGKMITTRTNATLKTPSDAYLTAIQTNVDTDSETEGSPNIANNYVFQFQDGIVFTFAKDAANCTETAPCKGFIDTNGVKGPNKLVTCTPNEAGSCTNKVTVNDIFPVRFYDQTVAPNSPAARAVLYGSENMETTTTTTTPTDSDSES